MESSHHDKKHNYAEAGSSSSAASGAISEDELALAVARVMKARIDMEVARYVESSDYQCMVEALKRSQREEALRTVEEEVGREKETLLGHQRRRMRDEVAEQVRTEKQEALEGARREVEAQTPQEILLQNRLRIERRQQAELDERLAADTLRLEAVVTKRKQEREQEREQERKRALAEEEQCRNAPKGDAACGTASAGVVGGRGSTPMVAFGMKKQRKGLF